MAHPERSVLLLDLSIQGDASVITLGGTAEPEGFAPGVRTRGAEKIAALDAGHTAAGFLTAVCAYTAAPAPSGFSFLRGAGSAPAKPFDWPAHCVSVKEVHPASNVPPNLFLAAGGRALYKLFSDAVVLSCAASLRAAFASMPANTIVLIDTDAELSERMASLLGIAAAQELCLVLTSSWTDYGRVLDDAANGLFAGMSWLSTNDPGFKAKVSAVVFNNVTKRLAAASDLCGSPSALSFTPPAPAKESITEILQHLFVMCTDSASNYRAYFSDAAAFADVASFTRRYVTGLATVPDSVWQSCLAQGVPVVLASPSDPQKASATQLCDVAKRLFG